MAERTYDPIAILSALFRHEVRFVAIGGWAATVQDAGWPTFDVDIVIEDQPENLERLVAALDELRAVYDTFHQPPLRPELFTVRQGRGPQLFRTMHGRLDVLKEAGGETYATLLEDAAEVEQHGHRVKCASLEALLRMKRAANRPKDQPAIAKIEARLREKGE